MKRKIVYLILVLLLPLASCGKEEATQTGPPDIQVFRTEARNVPIYQEFVGQVYGQKDIAIRARVEGYLEGIFFEEGSRIEKGKLLYILESQPFEADVAAKMSRLAEAKTARAKAESDLNRIRPLAEQKAVSESDLDAAVALHDASIASVEAAEANLRAAKIQLGYTKIYSPIKGIIGKTQAKVGDFVGREPNPVILNVVSQIDTILVQFFITETQYLTIARYIQTRESERGREDREARLELILADGSLYQHMGMIDFIDRGIDPTTGAILLQASFPNPDELLRPGQFARIKALVHVLEDGILVPQRCVSELQGLYRVYVVNKENKIELRDVTVGPKIGSFWLIAEGLGPDEMVVYEGLQRVGSDAAVNPVPVEIEMPVE